MFVNDLGRRQRLLTIRRDRADSEDKRPKEK